MAAVLAGSASLLGACGGSSGDALAHEACLDVQHSLTLYNESTHATSAAARTALAAKAQSALRKAMQPAALAGGGGGQWEALAITVSESSRVTESLLVTALSAQCASSLQST